MTSSTNTLGKYQIIREIARSNDIVYEAMDPSINRRIALKELFLAPNLTPAQKRERIERFHREGRAAGRLSHPNIVTIYEVGQDGDRYFIAMEYLEGQTLRDALQMEGAFPIKRATEIALEILSALSYAHLNGIVHRDIKPENIQILPGGHIKITDFGIARLMGEASITVDGQVFGTPSYMSPEQVAGKNIDQRSDLFAVGVVLYEMLSGHKPFSGDSVVTITYNIMHREPTPVPGIPPYLTSIVRKAMAKEQDDRYASADEMAEDLRNERAPFGVMSSPDNVSLPRPSSGSTYQGTVLPPPGSTGGFPPPATQGRTPYGTPIPSAPDPFSSPPPAQPSSYSPPVRVPREPILSPEARNFVGIFLLVLGLTGMFIFAVWAINVAYDSFQKGMGSKQGAIYLEQGRKLFEQGKYEDAVEQFSDAVRVAAGSPVGKSAKASLAACYVTMGVRDLNAGKISSAAQYAEQALQADSGSPPAHLLMGTVHSHMGETDKAVTEWKKVLELSPASNEAKTARENIGNFYYNQGLAYMNTGQQDKAIEMWRKVVEECAGTPIAITAQQQMDSAMGIGGSQQ